MERKRKALRSWVKLIKNNQAYRIDSSSKDTAGWVGSRWPHSVGRLAVAGWARSQRHPGAVALVAVAGDVSRPVPAATRSGTAVAVGTSYVAAAPADAGAGTVAASAATAAAAASACADAGCAFGGASAIQREADCPVHRARCLDDRQRPPEVCNWHIQWGWTGARWGLAYVPCDPYRYSARSICNHRPCRPYFRAPVDADSRPHSACRSDCTGETSDKACPVGHPRFHNGGRKLLVVTNSDRRDRQLAGTVAEPTASAEAPVRPHRNAVDADAGVPPRHFAGLGCTNSRSTNSCYCPTCPTY